MHSITETDPDELRTAYRNATETDAPDREDAVTVAYAPALAATLAANVAMINPDPDAPGLDAFAERIESHDDLADGVAALAELAAFFPTPDGEDRALTEIAEQVARDVVAEAEAATNGDDPDGEGVDVADVDLTTFEAAATAELSTAPGNSTGGARPSSNTALNANTNTNSDGPESVGTLADYRARSGDTDAEGFGDPAGAERQGRKYARAEREIQQSLAEQNQRRPRTNSNGDAERSAGTLADHRERQGRGDHTPAATGTAGASDDGGGSGPGKLDGDRWELDGGDDDGDTAPTGTLANYRNSRADRDDRPLRGVTVEDGRVYAGTNADTRTTERPPDRLSRHGRVVEAGSRQYFLAARKLKRNGRFPWKIPGADEYMDSLVD